MISVCIATYNGEKYIKQQLTSILKQLSADDEVIISDDGSTDQTLQKVKELQDDRIQIFHHKKDLALRQHHSPSFLFAAYNFEYAIQQAKGDFILLSDQDDLWAPNRVEVMLSYLQKNDFVMCNFSLIGPHDEVLLEKGLTQDPVRSSLFWNLWKVPFRGCCMAFQAAALQQALPLPRLCVGHDIWVGCYLMHKGYCYEFIPTPLHYYRSHESNVSPVMGKSTNSLWFKLSYRLRFLVQILFR